MECEGQGSGSALVGGPRQPILSGAPDHPTLEDVSPCLPFISLMEPFPRLRSALPHLRCHAAVHFGIAALTVPHMLRSEHRSVRRAAVDHTEPGSSFLFPGASF